MCFAMWTDEPVKTGVKPERARRHNGSGFDTKLAISFSWTRHHFDVTISDNGCESYHKVQFVMCDSVAQLLCKLSVSEGGINIFQV